jgi:hypothetical protein
MKDVWYIKLIKKRKQIIVLDKSNDRAYLISVLNNRFGNGLW